MFILDKEQCIQCETCVEECPNGCLSVEDGELQHKAERCMWCGHCLAVCPRDAIMIDGDGYNVEDVEEFQFFKKSTPDMVRRDIMMRRSVRHFNDTPVTEDEINRIIEAGKYAPTARNNQHNALLIKDDPEEVRGLAADLLEKLGEIGTGIARDMPVVSSFFLKKYMDFKDEGKDGLFYSAPLVIGVFSDSDVDGALCAAYMGQMIESLGLGFCYIQLAKEPMNDPQIREKYGIPEDKHCVIFLAIGNYDAEYFCSVPRKDLPLL